MNEPDERTDRLPMVLDRYAVQGRAFLFNAAQNLIQFGRVLYEAKPFVPRGQFERWVQESFGISERAAQQYMQVWRRFGESEALKDVKFSSLQKMLALPEGEEEAFAQNNDLANMTAREVERAVREERAKHEEETRKLRQEAETEISEAMARAKSAEDREAAMAARKAEIPAKLEADKQRLERQVEEYKAEIQRLAGKQADMSGAEREIQKLRRELKETEDALEENQREYDRMRGELLDAKSALAKGDAEREVSAKFTVADFSQAVRCFLGSVAQVPHMGWLFSDPECSGELLQWISLLQSVEDWTARARRAMETVGGGIVE